MKYFSKDHEWVNLEGDIATIGISVHAAAELGDVTFVELPETDESVDAGAAVSVVESVKAASDIYAPVAGTIIEVNEILEDEPEIINEDAEVKGWIFKLSGVSQASVEKLMTAEQYAEFIK
ncbi:glycine cleavage system protein GcvH [Lentisphaera profundi]|uniref:Glycine cleavage system H protein n=1 Tax=Lentisphaera profundi TaxID=1658616 RepID=A0ABY7VWC6_9BACT|nr:glycine cleavage system protein GcvH [Lentisphaera profundi]WDE97495.1 glycine cleavage system protein GcvH [Lentisphaera profundi]